MQTLEVLDGLSAFLPPTRVGLWLLLATLWACDADWRRKSVDPAEERQTERLVELLRAELKASDRTAASRAVHCESERLFRVLMQERGDAYAMGVVHAATERAFRGVDDSLLKQRDAALPGVVYAVPDKECTALARSGVLGDTVFPPRGEWRP